MSSGNLNGGVLSLSKLVVGGQTFTGASGLSGLLGSATGSVPTTASQVGVSVSGTAQTGVLTTASTMVLPPQSSGIVITGDATGSVACNGTGAIAMSVSPTAQTGVLTTASTIVLPPPGTGSGATLTGDATGSVATNATGNITVSVSPTAQTGVLTTATTMVLPPASAGAGVPTAIINPGATVGANPANPSWVAPVAPATSPYTLTLTNAQLEVCRVGATAFPAQTGIFQNAVWAGGFQLIGTNSLPVAPLCLPQYNPATGTNPTTYVFQCSGNPGANALAVQLLYAGS